MSGRNQQLTYIYRLLNQHFSLEELKTLCFDLGIDYENLSGSGKAAKARELVLYLDRRGQLPKLISVGKRQRPNVQWELESPDTLLDQENRIRSKVEDTETITSALEKLKSISDDSSEYLESLRLFETRIERAPNLYNERAKIASAFNYLASTFRSQGQLDKSRRYYEIALPFWQESGDRSGVARTLNNIGNNYASQGMLENAKDYLGQSLKIHQEIGDDISVANTLTNIGELLFSNGELSSAIEALNHAEQIWGKLGDKAGLFSTANTKGLVFTAEENFDAAMGEFRNALILARETGNIADEAETLNNLAANAYRLAAWGDAVTLNEEALALHEELNDLPSVASTLVNLGNAYFKSGRLDAALFSFERSYAITQRLEDGARGAATALGQMAAVFEASGDFDQALEHYDRALTIQNRLGDTAGASQTELRINLLNSQLKKEGRSLASIVSESQKFFEAAGFDLSTTGNLESFLCLPGKPGWRKRFAEVIYTEISRDEALDGNKVLTIRETALNYSPKITTAFVMVEHAVKDEAWLQIAALRPTEFNVIPIPITLLYEGRTSKKIASERMVLSKHLQRFLGKGIDPYDVRSPVSDVLNFFGREATAQEFKDQILDGHPIGIFGLRKIGKSSLMRYMQHSMPYPTAWIDLQAGVDAPSLFSRILQAWNNDARARFDLDLGLGKVKISPEKAGSEFFELTNEILEKLEEDHIPKEAGLAIFLDEIELIMPPLNATGSELESYFSLMRMLRGLVQEDGRISLIVAGVDPLVNRKDRWGNEQNPFYKLLQEEYLSPLHSDDCIQMVRNIGRQIELTYTDEALESIVRASGCHPFLARQLCSVAFNINKRHPGEVSANLINQAQEQFLFDPQYSSFLSDTGLWGEARSEALWGSEAAQANKQILLSLSQSEGPLAKLQLLDLGGNKAALHSAIYGLEQLSIIRKAKYSEEYFEISFGLLRSWIRRVYLGLPE